MIEDALQLGASRSSILRKMGLRPRIDARAPNVSKGANPTGMRRDPNTGFSEGWDQFFKFKGSELRSPGASAVAATAAPITPEMPEPMVAPNAFAPQPLSIGPSSQELATIFQSIPSMAVERGLPAGFETGVAQNYMSAASRNLRRRAY